MIAIYQHAVLFPGGTYDTWSGLAIMRIYVSPPEANLLVYVLGGNENPCSPRACFHPLTMHSYSFALLAYFGVSTLETTIDMFKFHNRPLL